MSLIVYKDNWMRVIKDCQVSPVDVGRKWLVNNWLTDSLIEQNLKTETTVQCEVKKRRNPGWVYIHLDDISRFYFEIWFTFQRRKMANTVVDRNARRERNSCKVHSTCTCSDVNRDPGTRVLKKLPNHYPKSFPVTPKRTTAIRW